MRTFKGQEWRLVTNLTKLRAVSSMTQQAATMWLEAVLLILPAGSSKGHRRRCWQLLETEAEPTTHPSAPWELRDEGTIILDPLNCDWCHSSWVLWLNILPTVAWGQYIFMWERQTHSRLQAIQIMASDADLTKESTSLLSFFCFFFHFTNEWFHSIPITYLIWQLVRTANKIPTWKLNLNIDTPCSELKGMLLKACFGWVCVDENS